MITFKTNPMMDQFQWEDYIR